jgi:hypothetical protein
MLDHNEKSGGLALKIAIGTGIALGAVVSGLLVSRRGRNLVREAWQGRRRTRLEDRSLDALWGDRTLGRRTLDVQEIDEGAIAISGVLRSEDERERAVEIVERIKGVRDVIDRLDVQPSPGSRRKAAVRD